MISLLATYRVRPEQLDAAIEADRIFVEKVKEHLVVTLLLTRVSRLEETVSGPTAMPVTDAEDIIAGDGPSDGEGPTGTREPARPRPAAGGG